MKTGWIVTAVLAVAVAATAQSLPPRRSFEIATGPAAGTYFPAGEMIARIVSHPPGMARCEKSPLCGPPGVIVSAKSSDGAVANVLAVNAGQIASGLAQANVIADAVAGRGEFRHAGRQTHIRVMADLFTEQLQLVVPRRSPIRSVADLKGKRISLGNPNSGSDVIAGEILKAYRVRPARIVRETYETSGGLMREGKLDAFFFLGGAPALLIADMVNRGQARLVPIDGKGRTKLLAAVDGVTADAIPARAYQGTGRIETVSSRTYWIVRDSAPNEAVYDLVRALYHPGNRALLDQNAMDTGRIRIGDAASLVGVPLHPGAARYYREAGILKPTPPASSPSPVPPRPRRAIP
jgi:TRAP transporter TAXI family solute receptor